MIRFTTRWLVKSADKKNYQYSGIMLDGPKTRHDFYLNGSIYNNQDSAEKRMESSSNKGCFRKSYIRDTHPP